MHAIIISVAATAAIIITIVIDSNLNYILSLPKSFQHRGGGRRAVEMETMEKVLPSLHVPTPQLCVPSMVLSFSPI